MKTERARSAPYPSYWRGKHVSEGRHFVPTLLPGGRRRGWRGALAGEAAPAAPATPKEATAVISIVGDEEFYVGKELVTREALIEKVKQTLKGEEPGGQVVYVRAMCTVKYAAVVSVVDALRDAGFQSVGLVANRDDAGASRARGAQYPTARGEEIPAAVSAASGSVPLLIEVESQTFVRLNSRRVPLSGLRAQLKRLLDGHGDRTALIKAPRAMPYCLVLNVVNSARAAGAHPVGLQIDDLK